MRHSIAFAVCALFAGCATYSEAPPNFELTWVKHNVAFETFVADVDTCNARAEAAGHAVEPRRGDPQNDLAPPILLWRWLVHAVDVDAAMTEAYDACFRPRGYILAYVNETDAQAFGNIGFEPINPDDPPGQRWSRKREAQLRLLYRLAIAEHPLRARIEPRQQRRPLVSYVARP